MPDAQQAWYLSVAGGRRGRLLASLLVVLITGCGRSSAPANAVPSLSPGSAEAFADAQGTHVDPVCSKPVDARHAPRSVHGVDVYYFCSAADKERFDRDPKSYVRKPLP
jgi:YHS domain-containing protein